VTATALLADGLGAPYAIEAGAGVALVAAFLNAAFGLCLGCELYLLLARGRAGIRARD
jgi:hypothetical protein